MVTPHNALEQNFATITNKLSLLAKVPVNPMRLEELAQNSTEEVRFLFGRLYGYARQRDGVYYANISLVLPDEILRVIEMQPRTPRTFFDNMSTTFAKLILVSDDTNVGIRLVGERLYIGYIEDYVIPNIKVRNLGVDNEESDR